MPAQLSNVAGILNHVAAGQREMRAMIVNLSNAANALRDGSSAGRRGAYEVRLVELQSQNCITPEIAANLANVGASTGWNLSNLDSLSGLRVTNRSRLPNPVAKPLDEKDVAAGVAMLLKGLSGRPAA